jgi:hypothetical protein
VLADFRETPAITEEVIARTEETVPRAEEIPTIAEDVVARDEKTSTIAEEPADEERVAPRQSGIISLGAEIDEDDEPIVVEELEPLEDVAVEAAVEITANDPWRQLCAVLAAVATAEGAPAVADALPAILVDRRIDGLADDAVAALTEGGLVADGALTAAFTTTADAWSAVLRGTSDDLDACGGATLDEWAADLLARLLGSAARAPAVRRELRSRGVAAFGLLEAA